MVLSGTGQELLESDEIQKAYLGRVIMEVKDYMSTNVITVTPETTVMKALDLMKGMTSPRQL